jgi:UDPglucose 6-dehydrogenase
MQVGVVGVGYVGLVVGTCLSDWGHRVRCADQNQMKIIALQNGLVPMYEPGIDELVRANLQNGRLTFTDDVGFAISASTCVFISVGTPPLEDGSADLSYVIAVAKEIGLQMNDYTVVVIKSTVPIGTSEQVRKTIQAQLDRRSKTAVTFDIVSNPEFLREGAAIHDFMNPDRIVVGTNQQRAIAVMQQLYEPLLKQGYPMILMDAASAELTKYAANAMLASRISLMNEMASLCEVTGADIELIRQGIATDQRIGKSFLSAGIGYGGSCFPKDVKALMKSAADRHIATPLLTAIEIVNQSQKKVMGYKVLNYFGGNLKNVKLAVWGLAFKPYTDDIRESPAMETVRFLLEQGAWIQVHDPEAIENAIAVFGFQRITYAQSAIEALQHAQALILLTQWKEYTEIPLHLIKENLKNPVVFDGRQAWNPQHMCDAGMIYRGIGRKMS